MKTLIIAGMHRSGTSLVTQWLNKCGLNVGNYCMGASPFNPDGHFEDLEFVHIHEDILRDNNLPATGLTDKPALNISAYNKSRFEHLFEQKNQFFYQWGWKDPRTCMFLPFYEQEFPDSNYLFIIRDYKSVVSSLLNREFRDIDERYMFRKFLSRFIWKNFRREARLKKFYQQNATHFLKMWIAYNEQINNSLMTLDPQKCLLMPYSLLQKKDQEIFRYLAQEWDMNLKYVPFKSIFKKDFISKTINIEDFIADQHLIEKADNLERDLQVKLLLQDLNVYA